MRTSGYKNEIASRILSPLNMFIDLVTRRSKPQNNPRIEDPKYKIALRCCVLFLVDSSQNPAEAAICVSI